MKIIYFGTPEFAVPSLKILNNIPHFEIVSVITQPDKAIGRKKIITPSPVKKTAIELGLKVFQPSNKNEIRDFLKSTPADLYIVIAFGMILSPEILNLPKYGALNVHASLLPKYRGASPIQESLLNGDKTTGISIIKMNDKMDQGDILLLKRLNIDQNDNYPSLSKKLSELSGIILPLAIMDFIENNLNLIKQNNNQATYCRKITKKDGKIDFKKQKANEIINMLKAYTPWPGVYFDLKDKSIKIIETDYENTVIPAGKFQIEGKNLKIGTQKGAIIPKKIQIQGKNEMEIQDFLNGYSHLIPS